MMSNTEELQYGECCCCLEKGHHREITKQYYLDKQPEIYEVLFKNTFNIVLKYPENTKLICNICIAGLRQATHFKFMVESIQQRLSECVKWLPQIDNVTEVPDTQKTESIKIKCEPDYHMEEAKNDAQLQSTYKEVHYDAEEIDIKEENLEVPLEIELKTERIECESDNHIEEVNNDVQESTYKEIHYDAEEIDIKEENLDPSTSSSDKLVITRHRNNTFKVNKQLVPPLYRPRDFKRHVCGVCPYKTANKGHLNEHRRTHTGEKPFTCDICQYKSAIKRNLLIHIRTHTRKRKFSCEICQFKAASKGNLTIHMRTHTDERPFSCHICQHKLPTKGSLTRHIIRTHTEKKTFSCHICQYKSAYRGDLAKHVRCHIGVKPFSCDICQFKSATKEDLTNHIRIHTRKKDFLQPFSCTICQFKSEFKEQLMAHICTRTEENIFSCEICQFKTEYKIILKSHLLSHTGEKPIKSEP